MAAPPRRDQERDIDVDPPYLYPEYVATRTRAPRRPLVLLPHSLTELTAPVLGVGRVGPGDADLTARGAAEPMGERIIVHGKVMDSDGRAVRNTLVELWQANAAGRYKHEVDQHPAPLDPNFDGVGRALTDDQGRFRFVTIRPGPYPWRNSYNAWRAAHIHFSLFGDAFLQRLVTQMYFPGDQLFWQDPIFNAVPDPKGRDRMVSSLDLPESVAEWALAYRFDIVLRGRGQTPMEDVDDDA